MHVDAFASTFWQLLLRGRKRWTLFALPDELRRALLYSGVEHEIIAKYPLPGEERNASAYPLLDVAEEFKVVVEVGPGDLMVVPRDVPHMVENLEDVLAISMNVLDPPALPRAMEDLTMRNCFSDVDWLGINLRLLSESPSPAAMSESDVPFAEFRAYSQ